MQQLLVSKCQPKFRNPEVVERCLKAWVELYGLFEIRNGVFQLAGLQVPSAEPPLGAIDFVILVEGGVPEVFVPMASGTGLPRGMNLSSADASFNALVGVDSLQEPGLPRVTPNDADSSYLVDKLEGNQAPGTTRMPQGGPFLDQATIDVIRAWIDNGAVR